MKYTKITIKIHTQDKPPYFMGSQLRGAFGYALKKVVCINPLFECKNCFASSNCIFYDFYEEKNSFHKYRFDFKIPSQTYDFNLFLFDDTCLKLPFIFSALHMMITQNGLGKDKKVYKNFEIFINDKNCFKNKKIELPKNFINKFEISSIHKDIVLNIKTPLRIKKDGKFIRSDAIELNDLINSIYQRQMKLLGRNFKKFPYEIKGEIVHKNLKYKELTRFSNRQKTTMHIGGVIGEIKIKNINKECFEVLKVGELISVGKQTVFGLGKIEILKKEDCFERKEDI